MGKIDNSMIKENIKNVFDGLKDVVTAYAAYSNKMKDFFENVTEVVRVRKAAFIGYVIALHVCFTHQTFCIFQTNVS